MLAFILADTPQNKKLFAALLALFGLKTTAIAAIVGTFLIVALFIFTILLDALYSVCCHIAQVWSESNALERLLIFFLAWLFLYKLAPLVARMIKRRGNF
jgi:hypothetical protein